MSSNIDHWVKKLNTSAMRRRDCSDNNELLEKSINEEHSERQAYLAKAIPTFFVALRVELEKELERINGQLSAPADRIQMRGNQESLQDILLHPNVENWFSTEVSYEVGVGTFLGEVLETHRRPDGKKWTQDVLFLSNAGKQLRVTTSRDTYDVHGYAIYLLNKYLEERYVMHEPSENE